MVSSPATNPQISRIRDLFQPTLNFLGYELYDLALTGTAGHTTLRVRIDRPEGVTLDDADPLPTRYDLEVSSPGAERPLRNLDEYRRFIGKRSNVRYRIGDSEQVAEGRLMAVSDEAIELQLGEGRHLRTAVIPLTDILAARLAVDLSRH
ncbi:MAG: ribosome maturation factor RimP [Chloroflexi bacterium]|nr:MAG: ribosome maturation factor RimP [Chloroflexota bacterium]